MEYPWETIVKLYRAQKRDRSEPTVESWALDFIAFLRRFGRIRQKEINENVHAILDSVFEEVETLAIQSAHLRNLPVPSNGYEDLLLELLESRIRGVKASGRLLTAAQSRYVLSRFGNHILSVVAHFVPSSKNRKLLDAAIEYGSRFLISNSFSPISTGVVVAGFGSSELFPSQVQFETDGYVGRQIKISKPDVSIISKRVTSSVSAFAQHDIVHRFMEGIDPDYGRYLEGSIRTALVEGNISVFEKWAPASSRNQKTRALIRRAAERQFKRIHDAAIAYRRQEFWLPTVQMVSLLPKDELAHLAESLVELTSLHRRVSREIETVGGAIDVAVISKGDGFVWVKRKHYFKPELNPQFDRNYMRDIPPRRR